MAIRNAVYPLVGRPSVAEEWEGRGDVLLNAYLMVAWLLLGAGFVTFSVL